MYIFVIFQRHAVKRTGNRSVFTAPCVQWAVTMPVMELYRPLPDQESCTEGIVGTAAALRVTTTGRGGIRRTKEMRTRNRVDFGMVNIVVKGLSMYGNKVEE